MSNGSRVRQSTASGRTIASLTGTCCLPLGCLAVFLTVPHAASANLISDIVGDISQSQYTTYVQNLQDFGTRYYNTSGNLSALSYLYSSFSSFGLNVAYDPFSYNGQTYNNVVATLPGRTNPNEVYIVGAHMDSTSTNPTQLAPGADDNASGMAAVLEMASILAHRAFDATIKFIGFNAEEQGLKGSQAYAADAAVSHEDIKGMLNFDMIAYAHPGSPESVYLAGDSNLVDMMAANALSYTSLASQKTYANIFGSDHYYFYSGLLPGSTSAFAIETAPANIPSYNPYYHQIADTADNLDFAYASEITRMGIATIAELAGPIPEPPALPCLMAGFAVLAWGRYRLKRLPMAGMVAGGHDK